MTDQAMNIDAYNTAIITSKSIQPQAVALKKAWEKWYTNLSWTKKNFISAIQDQAKERYNAYTIANAKTKKAAKDLDHYYRTGEMVYKSKAQGNKTRKVTAKRATVRNGSHGSTVAEWQRIIGVIDDGKFGPQTKAATIKWQQAHGLTADGIVGPNTWAAVTEESDTVIDKAIRPIKRAAAEVKEAVEFIPLWQKLFGGFITAGIVYIGVDELRKK